MLRFGMPVCAMAATMFVGVSLAQAQAPATQPAADKSVQTQAAKPVAKPSVHPDVLLERLDQVKPEVTAEQKEKLEAAATDWRKEYGKWRGSVNAELNEIITGMKAAREAKDTKLANEFRAKADALYATAPNFLDAIKPILSEEQIKSVLEVTNERKIAKERAAKKAAEAAAKKAQTQPAPAK